MRSKHEILKDVRSDILDEKGEYPAHLWIQHRLIEVLLDIRDALLTDCKDAMNALIEIRRNKDDEREI